MAPPPPARGGTVFVTVGTTRFDALVEAVDSEEVAAALAGKGYARLVVQLGASAYRPRVLLPEGAAAGRHAASGLQVEWFEYAPSLEPYMESAALVISHAGRWG